jgi:hypothetical protein
MSPNRVVAVLTPLVFAPAAGAITAWVAENFPGVEISQSRVEEIFIAGALIALAPAVQWLHGWQKHEAREAQAQQAVEVANAAAAPQIVEQEPDLELDDEFEELDELDDSEVFAELDELDELDDAEAFEDLDDEQLADEEQPARTAG